MRGRFGWLLVGVVMLALAASVGMYTYNIGVAHGVAESARLAAERGGSAPAVALWPRPWGFGFGFGFFPFFPLLFIVFWLFIIRGLFWRGGWGPSTSLGAGRGCGYGYGGVPPAFDEWHRRAHAQQGPPQSQTNV
jgi:hypothetical protein